MQYRIVWVENMDGDNVFLPYVPDGSEVEHCVTVESETLEDLQEVIKDFKRKFLGGCLFTVVEEGSRVPVYTEVDFS